jgi:hypothetical protein
MDSPGRPYVLDDRRCAEICDLAAAGHSIRNVARLIGCDVKTIRRHAARDPNFGRLLTTAVISARHDPLKMMRRAAGASWRAAAWLLERTEPDRYGKQPPATCRPEDVDRAFTRIMDTALGHIQGDAPRRAMYQSLAKVMEAETIRLFLPPAVRNVVPKQDLTFHVDDQRLKDFLDSVSNCYSPSKAPAPPPDKAPSASPAGPKTGPSKTPANPEANCNRRC